jgi:hypothetical protein
MLLALLIAVPFLMGGCPIGGQSLTPIECAMFNAGVSEVNRLSRKAALEGLTPAEQRRMDNLVAALMALAREVRRREEHREMMEGEAERLAELHNAKDTPNDRPYSWGSDNQPWSPDNVATGGSRTTTTMTRTGLPCGATVVSVKINGVWYSSSHAPYIPSDWSSQAEEVYYELDGKEYHVDPWMPTLPTNSGWSNPRAKNFTPPNQGLIQNRE